MLIEEPAFADLDFGEDPFAEASAAPVAPATVPPAAKPNAKRPAKARPSDDEEAAVPPPVAASAAAGMAYITVTDAAGRVLFRRAATPSEVADALRSADTATGEGEAAMDRIAYDRLFTELNQKTAVESIGEPLPVKDDSP